MIWSLVHIYKHKSTKALHIYIKLTIFSVWSFIYTICFSPFVVFCRANAKRIVVFNRWYRVTGTDPGALSKVLFWIKNMKPLNWLHRTQRMTQKLHPRYPPSEIHVCQMLLWRIKTKKHSNSNKFLKYPHHRQDSSLSFGLSIVYDWIYEYDYDAMF